MPFDIIRSRRPKRVAGRATIGLTAKGNGAPEGARDTPDHKKPRPHWACGAGCAFGNRETNPLSGIYRTDGVIAMSDSTCKANAMIPLQRLLTGLFLMMPTPAIASDWYWISGTPDAIFFADADGLIRTSSFSEVWINSSYRIPIAGKVSYTKELFRANCTARSIQVLDQHAYAVTGEQIAERSFSPTIAISRPTPPDSNDEAILTFACKYRRGFPPNLNFPIDRSPQATAKLAFQIMPLVDARIGAVLLAGSDPERSRDILEDILAKHVKAGNHQRVRTLIGLTAPAVR